MNDESKHIRALLQQDRSLTEIEAVTILSEYNITFPATVLATSPKEAEAAVRKMGGPAVMKIVSRDISHKSEVGGVITGITEETAAATYERILEEVHSAFPKATIEGILVQQQEVGGVEVIIGAIRDLQFGHAVMFGLGGVLAEALTDVVFRIAPLTKHDAREMIDSIRGTAILYGQRGQAPAKIEALSYTLMGVSRFVGDYPQVAELDLNPVIVTKEKAVAVDALIRVEDAEQP